MRESRILHDLVFKRRKLKAKQNFGIMDDNDLLKIVWTIPTDKHQTNTVGQNVKHVYNWQQLNVPFISSNSPNRLMWEVFKNGVTLLLLVISNSSFFKIYHRSESLVDFKLTVSHRVLTWGAVQRCSWRYLWWTCDSVQVGCPCARAVGGASSIHLVALSSQSDDVLHSKTVGNRFMPSRIISNIFLSVWTYKDSKMAAGWTSVQGLQMKNSQQ